MSKITKEKLYNIVFEAETLVGKIFDIWLLVLIALSILIVMLESVQSINQAYLHELRIFEWIITILFTIEYFLRIAIVKHPLKYIFSFYGIVDFFSIIPTYIGIFVSGAHGLLIIRALRLLRIFRILKLSRYVSESSVIIKALYDSRIKIGVFLYSVLMIVIIIGTTLYFIEGEESGFTSIPQSIYWAIVTLTTVGYGDIAPMTTLGKFIAGAVMILGYAIIAVPTGIVTAQLVQNKNISTETCPNCLKEGHEPDALFCKYCGENIKC